MRTPSPICIALPLTRPGISEIDLQLFQVREYLVISRSDSGEYLVPQIRCNIYMLYCPAPHKASCPVPMPCPIGIDGVWAAELCASDGADTDPVLTLFGKLK